MFTKVVKSQSMGVRWWEKWVETGGGSSKGGKHTIRKLCAKRGGIEKVLLWWCGGRGGLNLCNRNNFFRKIASSEPNDEERSGGQQQKKRLLIENLSLQQQLYQIEQVVAWCT